MKGQGAMQWVEEGIISQSNAYQSAPEAFSEVIATPEGVSFPFVAELTAEEDLEQKHSN